MEFENDLVKGSLNLKKHKVSFEEAASVFGDPMAYVSQTQTIQLVKNVCLCLGYRERSACSPLSTRTGVENIALSLPD
jgi:uncharacterized DUF497 family protein